MLYETYVTLSHMYVTLSQMSYETYVTLQEEPFVSDSLTHKLIHNVSNRFIYWETQS